MTRGELGLGTLLFVGCSSMTRYFGSFGTFSNIHIYYFLVCMNFEVSLNGDSYSIFILSSLCKAHFDENVIKVLRISLICASLSTPIKLPQKRAHETKSASITMADHCPSG
jgi:hypothetical protein